MEGENKRKKKRKGEHVGIVSPNMQNLGKRRKNGSLVKTERKMLLP